MKKKIFNRTVPLVYTVFVGIKGSLLYIFFLNQLLNVIVFFKLLFFNYFLLLPQKAIFFTLPRILIVFIFFLYIYIIS